MIKLNRAENSGHRISLAWVLMLLMQTRYVVTNSLRCCLVERIEDYPRWRYSWIGTQEDLFP